MGPGLADGRPEFAATGSGVAHAAAVGASGSSRRVNGHTRFLHDGRARSLEEAILWHGGEAAAAQAGLSRSHRSRRGQLARVLGLAVSRFASHVRCLPTALVVASLVCRVASCSERFISRGARYAPPRRASSTARTSAPRSECSCNVRVTAQRALVDRGDATVCRPRVDHELSSASSVRPQHAWRDGRARVGCRGEVYLVRAAEGRQPRRQRRLLARPTLPRSPTPRPATSR